LSPHPWQRQPSNPWPMPKKKINRMTVVRVMVVAEMVPEAKVATKVVVMDEVKVEATAAGVAGVVVPAAAVVTSAVTVRVRIKARASNASALMQKASHWQWMLPCPCHRATRPQARTQTVSQGKTAHPAMVNVAANVVNATNAVAGAASVVVARIATVSNVLNAALNVARSMVKPGLKRREPMHGLKVAMRAVESAAQTVPHVIARTLKTVPLLIA
jgi:ABC-type proline/glycine betaine transport system ATPase subunit